MSATAAEEKETAKGLEPVLSEAAHTSESTVSKDRAGGLSQVYRDENGLERLVFFSDAVFAIAITLVALEIRLPQMEGEVSNDKLLSALSALWPRYLGFGISFLAIGLYWLAHHRTFRTVVRYDMRLMVLNLLLLASVAFMPFPTSVVSEYANRVGTQLYALAAAIVGSLMTAIWLYTHINGRMTEQPMTRREFRRGLVRVLVAPVVFALSIVLAVFNEDLAKFSWLLIAVAHVIR